MTANQKYAPRPSLGLIVLLGALTAFPALSTDLYLPALPRMTADLRTVPSMAALTLSAFFLGMTAGQFVYGPWSDRVGRRGPLLAGLGVFVAASIGCALAQSIEFLIAMRFLQAFGGCAGPTIARAAVRDRYDPQSTARVLAYLSLVFGVAPIAGPMCGSLLLLAGDWRTVFFVLAGFGAVCAASVYFFLPESVTHDHSARARLESPAQAYRALMTDRTFMTYAFVGGFAAASLMAYVAMSPELFIQVHGLSAQSYAMLFGLNAIGLIGAGQINAYILRRSRYAMVIRRATVAAAMLALIFLICAFTSIGGLWAVAVVLFCVVGSVGFVMGNAMTGALSGQGHRAGAASSLSGAMGSIGAVISVTVTGALYDGSARAIGLVIFICLASAALILRALPRDY